MRFSAVFGADAYDRSHGAGGLSFGERTIVRVLQNDVRDGRIDVHLAHRRDRLERCGVTTVEHRIALSHEHPERDSSPALVVLDRQILQRGHERTVLEQHP
ncbi:MAG: hypothetical protein JW751_06420 [Polyangiaceae bacterium]|nr:hypothetical protein [Polyangiaceae bacterium]